MSASKLAHILDQGARGTNKRVLRDARNGLRAHEPTLTQNFVSDYLSRARRASLATRVREFTIHEEATAFGADLALWFTDGVGQFAGVYLQAKAIYQDQTYRRLDHANHHGTQYDMLVEAAVRDGVAAGYAFYSGYRGAEPRSSACPHGRGSPEINGITVASAASLSSKILKRVPRQEIEALTSPLSCLVRHQQTWPPSHSKPGNSPTSSTGRASDGLLESIVDSLRHFAAQPDGEVRVHDQSSIPSYLRALDGGESLNHEVDDQSDYEPRMTVLLTTV